MLMRNSLCRGSGIARFVRFQSALVKPDPTNVEQQAPNRIETWSPSQRERTDGLSGARIIGRDLSKQPRAYAAIELIAQQPIRYIHDNIAVCEGNKSGGQGHPKIFINLDQEKPHPCGYCGLRFAKEEFKASIEA